MADLVVDHSVAILVEDFHDESAIVHGHHFAPPVLAMIIVNKERLIIASERLAAKLAKFCSL
jgi:hypothetical protein